jgi:hypothetical protein
VARTGIEGWVVVSRGDEELARWPLDLTGPADLGTVDALARLRLAAGRLGWDVHLHDTSIHLADLVSFVGLPCVLRDDG